MGSCRKRILQLLTVLLGCALASAVMQTTPEVRIRTAAWFPSGLVIKAEANLVELGVIVRDAYGHTVSGLKASDFEVLDDHHPRDITIFAEQRSQPASGRSPAAAPEPARTSFSAPGTTVHSPSTAPAPVARSIALFFDDVHASMMGLRKSAEAAEKLVAGGLAPGDRVAIFTASGTVDVDFTNDWERIGVALARLRLHPSAAIHTSDACPQLTDYQAYVITRHLDLMAKQVAVAEAVACKCPDPTPECINAQQQSVLDLAATVWELSKDDSITSLEVLGIVMRHVAAAPAKRMLVLLSPGLLTGGLEEQTSALTDIALRANITIAALNSEGLIAPTMQRGGHARWEDRSIGQREQVLSEFPAAAASATGGQYLHNTNDLAGGLRAATAIPEVSYLLGFSPPGRPDGKYHELKTRVRRGQGYRVESRAGYYSAGFTRETETAQERIDRIAMSGAVVEELPASVRLQRLMSGDGQATLQVTVAVDARSLKFAAREGRHVEVLTFLTVLEDAQGDFIAGKQSEMGMALTSASLAKLRENGIRAVTSFAAPPGSYRVREVLREAAQNHIWASSTPVEIR